MLNGMAINPYAYDPYFLQAYQYPNAQYLALQAQALQQAQQAQNPSFTQTAATQTQAAQEPEKKSHKGAWALIGTVATVGAAVLFHKKGGQDLGFFKRIADGAVKCKDGVVNWAKNIKISGLIPKK